MPCLYLLYNPVLCIHLLLKMPVPSFLSSFADKAQSALNASPLAAHLPSAVARPSSPDPSPQPTANQAAGQGGAKSHTLESLQYQFRTLQQQYSYVFLLHIPYQL